MSDKNISSKSYHGNVICIVHVIKINGKVYNYAFIKRWSADVVHLLSALFPLIVSNTKFVIHSFYLTIYM